MEILQNAILRSEIYAVKETFSKVCLYSNSPITSYYYLKISPIKKLEHLYGKKV